MINSIIVIVFFIFLNIEIKEYIIKLNIILVNISRIINKIGCFVVIFNNNIFLVFIIKFWIRVIFKKVRFFLK